MTLPGVMFKCRCGITVALATGMGKDGEKHPRNTPEAAKARRWRDRHTDLEEMREAVTSDPKEMYCPDNETLLALADLATLGYAVLTQGSTYHDVGSIQRDLEPVLARLGLIR